MIPLAAGGVHEPFAMEKKECGSAMGSTFDAQRICAGITADRTVITVR